MGINFTFGQLSTFPWALWPLLFNKYQFYFVDHAKISFCLLDFENCSDQKIFAELISPFYMLSFLFKLLFVDSYGKWSQVSSFMFSVLCHCNLNFFQHSLFSTCLPPQGLFEGLKAYKKEDGKILLFRPEENAQRMRMGAERMCMPSPTVEQFVEAVKVTVLANERWVCATSNFQ